MQYVRRGIAGMQYSGWGIADMQYSGRGIAGTQYSGRDIAGMQYSGWGVCQHSTHWVVVFNLHICVFVKQTLPCGCSKMTLLLPPFLHTHLPLIQASYPVLQ